jgi:plasmid stability protein
MTRQSDSGRITVTLPSGVFMALRDRADREGRSTSNLAAFLLENALANPKQQPVDRGFKADSGLRGSTAAMP